MGAVMKITYWGMAGCGKTTIIDTLHRITSEEDKDFKPKGPLIKIARDSGATLYYDRGYFHAKNDITQLYNIVTVAGQKAFSAIRKRVFENTEGVVFVVDSQTKYLEDNIEYLKELKMVTDNTLITEIPMIVMLNKQDLGDVINRDQFRQVLKDEELWFEPDNELSIWNPVIYETCALYDKRKGIYRTFNEIIRRTNLYRTIGEGKAPKNLSGEINEPVT